MIQFQTFAHLADIDLGEAVSKPTAVEGNPMEAAQALWTSPDGKVEIGVWECTPGRFTTRRDGNSETCHIVSGRISLHEEGGRTQEVRPGEVLVLANGWRGEWTIHEKTRKLYIIHHEG